MRKIMFLLITTVLFCGWGVNASVASGYPLYGTVTVESNDTLWSIAASRTDDSKDIREVIYDIQQLNGIKDPGQIQPGDKIKVRSSVI